MIKVYSLVFIKTGTNYVWLYACLANNIGQAIILAQNEQKKMGTDPNSMTLLLQNEMVIRPVTPSSIPEMMTADTQEPPMNSEIFNKVALMNTIINLKDRELLNKNKDKFNENEFAYLNDELNK